MFSTRSAATSTPPPVVRSIAKSSVPRSPSTSVNVGTTIDCFGQVQRADPVECNRGQLADARVVDTEQAHAGDVVLLVGGVVVDPYDISMPSASQPATTAVSAPRVGVVSPFSDAAEALTSAAAIRAPRTAPDLDLIFMVFPLPCCTSTLLRHRRVGELPCGVRGGRLALRLVLRKTVTGRGRIATLWGPNPSRVSPTRCGSRSLGGGLA